MLYVDLCADSAGGGKTASLASDYVVERELRNFLKGFD